MVSSISSSLLTRSSLRVGDLCPQLFTATTLTKGGGIDGPLRAREFLHYEAVGVRHEFGQQLRGEVGVGIHGNPMPLIHVVAGGDEGILAAQRFAIEWINFEDGLLGTSHNGEKKEDLAAHLKDVPVWPEGVRQRGARKFHGVGGGAGLDVHRR